MHLLPFIDFFNFFKRNLRSSVKRHQSVCFVVDIGELGITESADLFHFFVRGSNFVVFSDEILGVLCLTVISPALRSRELKAPVFADDNRLSLIFVSLSHYEPIICGSDLVVENILHVVFIAIIYPLDATVIIVYGDNIRAGMLPTVVTHYGPHGIESLGEIINPLRKSLL